MDTSLLVIERTLSAPDAKQHIPFTFQVPAGTTQLTIRLTFSPPMVDNIHNMLTLSVFDPSGFRGAGHRHGATHEVVIRAHEATPGYGAGPIPAGVWTMVVDTHMVMPGAPCVMRLEIGATGDLTPVPVPTSNFQLPTSNLVTRHPSPVTPTWYRGDLHAHSLHSDARWDIPDLLRWARAQRLDFCTLSDHNTVSGLAQMDAACRDDPSAGSGQVLLTMGGMELTTFWGHALALGLREWIDWRVRDGERTMPQIAAEVTTRGGTFIIAHPMSIGDPYCTGCQWRYADMMPGTARLVEVWNGPWVGDGSSNNEDALALVYAWLNAGHRLALTAGTDHHGSDSERRATHGFDVVYANELSERQILRAVRAGHLYLSSGPRFELTAMCGDQQAMMGDALMVAARSPIQVAACWSDAPDNAELSLIADGQPRETVRVGASGEQIWQLEARQAHWCLLTLRREDGQMLALTNPIYLNG